jgi:hypothetical protein
MVAKIVHTAIDLNFVIFPPAEQKPLPEQSDAHAGDTGASMREFEPVVVN